MLDGHRSAAACRHVPGGEVLGGVVDVTQARASGLFAGSLLDRR